MNNMAPRITGTSAPRSYEVAPVPESAVEVIAGAEGRDRIADADSWAQLPAYGVSALVVSVTSLVPSFKPSL